ncbi:hypothetical protein J2X97_002459 [Epilithonimonas hungarica]|jgi:Uncharacterized protein conserved in bacteria|uniref:DUF2059 domain-containing protein n=1 Tax=Epilithonimonas hungarica TaxID=454006 RepID=UPI0027812187|nr:DUF2059 domain-containing protein [Epilithonimonas hungarica]MDP9956800.1 hypothetical protein [Epilithonimonas hungarica]
MKKIILLVIFFNFVFSYSQNKQEKVKELISLSGTFTLSKKVEAELISRYRKRYENVPDSAWKSIEPKINIDELINEVADIYGSKLTEKEIDQLLVFYKSDLGKKVIQNAPIIMTQIQTSSSNWATKVTNIINSDLEKMGYLQSPPPPQSNPPAPMIQK